MSRTDIAAAQQSGMELDAPKCPSCGAVLDSYGNCPRAGCQ
jgi:tRNA(Ile2) C34 agmatinyltransferase TiaS